MANKIQIKRSTVTAAPTGLANGELAYTANGGILFIGHPTTGATLAIGGDRNPGILTANQALVVNATSEIDKIIVANVVPTFIYANGAVGTAGQVLTSGGSGNVYWNTPVDISYDLLAVANTAANEGRIRLNDSTNANDDVLFVGSGGITISSNATAIDVALNSTLSIADLTVSGNLTVGGDLTTINVATLSIEDPLIELSRSQANSASYLDVVDIGFYGQYGNTSSVGYTGLFRDATDSKYKLFSGNIPAPGSTVDTASPNYAGAGLVVQSLEGASATSFIDNFILDGGTF